MRILLLAHGDPEAKDLLRAAIVARYGSSPPAIETLRIDFKGSTKVKIGPVKTGIPLDIRAQFRFPTSMRLDFTARTMGLTVRRGIEAFDGQTYRSVRGGNSPTVVSEVEAIHSMRRRLWAMAALLLTPIGDMYVKLSKTGERSFEALNTELGDAVTLSLRENNTLNYVQTDCLNLDSGQVQSHTLRVSDEQALVDELMLPKKISAFWDDQLFFAAEPLHAESNPQIPDGVFSLEEE